MAKLLSTEDKNLQNSALTTSRSRVYSDIDLSLAVNTSTGDIFKKKDAAAVKQSVKNILQTNRFEKPFKPDFGADIRGLLFELADDDSEDDLKEQIKGAINRFEPRANIQKLEVRFTEDQNTVRVKLEFKILSIDETVSLETTVSRLR